jgi:hypothetical protein
MLFQSKQLGLTGQWSAIKRAYSAANRILGDVIKVHTQAHVDFQPRACLYIRPRQPTDSSHGTPTTSALGSQCGPCLHRMTFQECFFFAVLGCVTGDAL